MTAADTLPTDASSPANDAGPNQSDPSGASPIPPAELAELLSAFNDASEKLQATHERLTGEVRRLKAELSDANDRLARSRRLAALGEMAAGIAHEIRNPLAGLRLYAEMIETDLAEHLSDHHAEHPGARAPSLAETHRSAGAIIGAVRTIDGIVRDVLRFARETEPEIERADTRELIEQASSLALGAASADVQVHIDPSAGEVSCDPSLIRQALANLISNARDAHDSADQPARTITVHARRVDDTLELAVLDRGPGVPADVLERMFNPFFTTRAAGTGLGLAIVHRIAEAHGGEVRVHNRVLEGALGTEVAKSRDPAGAEVVLVIPDSPRDGPHDPGEDLDQTRDHARGSGPTPQIVTRPRAKQEERAA